MAVQIEIRQFNVDEFQRMVEAGILQEDDRVELVEGDIVVMSPIGGRHVTVLNRLTRLLGQLAAPHALISVQNPIHLGSRSQPQPDIALLRLRDDFYAGELARPADVLLVIEVGETSLAYDREVKAGLYARAGIPEYWLVSLPDQLIEVYSRPAKGRYQDVREAVAGEEIQCVSIPALVVRVDEVLG